MTIATWCVLAAGLMPLMWTALAKARGGRFDNRDPRAWQARLAGMPARAHAAHLNSFEAFPLFAAAVIIAQAGGAEQGRIDLLALSFIALRLIFGLCYILDLPRTRSLIWLLALLCCIGLFLSVP